MIIVAPRSAKLVDSHGSRFTLLVGFVFCLLAFLEMLLLWDEGVSYWVVGLGYLLIGIGVGFAGTPASRSLTGSVPVKRAGMASGTADLQRDLGGAIMQSIFGALLTAGYAASFSSQIAASPQADKVSEQVQNELTKSFASAADTAEQYPEYAPPDHRRRPHLVPRRRRLDLRRRDDRGRPRHRRRLLPLPQARGELSLLERFHGEDAGRPRRHVGCAVLAWPTACSGRRRLLAAVEPDEGREHRPRQAARGERAGGAALAAGAGAGLDQAPPRRAGGALRAARGQRPGAGRRRSC